MDEKQRILDLIQTKPKHYAKMIRGDSELIAWVVANSTTADSSFAAQIYSAVTGTSGQCPNGNKFSFRSVTDGWAGCGKASTCQCVRDSTSSAVSASKQAKTKAEKDATNSRRKATNIKRYGVTNAGQTAAAKTAHRAFYGDSLSVASQVSKQQQTMLVQHGVTNAAHLPAAIKKKKETNIERYGVENPMQNIDVAKRSTATRVEKYDAEAVRKQNYLSFIEKCKRDWRVLPLIAESEYAGMYPLPKLPFQCADCGSIEERTMDYGRPPICKICNPTQVSYESREEVDVREFIASIYPGPIRVRDRSIINPSELDIVLPDLNLAIEYCGLYWHSENSSNKSYRYHEKKMKDANAKGYRLITIFSDEWLQKQDIVKAKLRALVSKDSWAIGARKCQVRMIDSDSARAFLNQYHVQGAPRYLAHNVGLFTDSQLVAVGAFNIRNGETTLSRFASSRQVIGGCGKIISHFLKTVPSDHIVSFADLRWSEGNMYRKLGFEEVSRVPPMQSYVGDGYTTRFDKRQLSHRRRGTDKTQLTEWQAVQALGFDRIWDCGKIKFKLNCRK